MNRETSLFAVTFWLMLNSIGLGAQTTIEIASANNNTPQIVVAELSDTEVRDAMLKLIVFHSAGDSYQVADLRKQLSRLVNFLEAQKLNVVEGNKVSIIFPPDVEGTFAVEDAVKLYMRARFGGASKSFSINYLGWLHKLGESRRSEPNASFFMVSKSHFVKANQIQRRIIQQNGFALKAVDAVYYCVDGDTCWILVTPQEITILMVGFDSRFLLDLGFQNVFRECVGEVKNSLDKSNAVLDSRLEFDRVYAMLSKYYRKAVLSPREYGKLLQFDEVMALLDLGIGSSVEYPPNWRP